MVKAEFPMPHEVREWPTPVKKALNRSVVIRVTIAALAAAAVLTWIDVRQQREFRRLIATGDAALARDQTFAAIEAFSGAIALKRDAMVAYLKRGDTYRHRGEYAAALRDLAEAARLDPTAPRPVELLGDVNEALARHTEAIAEYRRSLNLDDAAPRVLYKLGEALYQAERPSDALEPLRKAIALDPRSADAQYVLGLCLRALRQPDEATRAFRQAVTLNPSFVDAHEELASLYETLGRRRDQLEEFEALAVIQPQRADRLVNVALTYAKLGRHDAAMVTLGRAADQHPGDPIVYAAIGRVWLDVAEQDNDDTALRRALDALQIAARDSAASSEALTLYGRALLLSGDTRQAERVLQDATSRTPAEPEAYEALAEAARHLNHRDVESTALAQYAALAP
jgi:tetratricopeptide (TPR) repeat protein